jgi:ankyrin repeat protein
MHLKSLIKNMFGYNSKSFGDTEKIIGLVLDNLFYDMKTYVETRAYTAKELNGMIDSNHNNLLHLATLNDNFLMVAYLLELGIDSNKLNKFKKTPWDIAVMNRNDQVLNKYIEYRGKKLCICSSKIELLNTKVKNMTYNHEKIIDSNKELSYHVSMLESKVKDNKKLEIDLSNVRQSNQTLSSELKYTQSKYSNISAENDNLRLFNKRLRDENDDLIDKNKKLKTSVETLMANSRK